MGDFGVLQEKLVDTGHVETLSVLNAREVLEISFETGHHGPVSTALGTAGAGLRSTQHR